MQILIEENGKAEEGTLGRARSKNQVIKEIADDKLRDSLTSLTAQLSELLTDIKQVGEFKLQQVQMGVEVTAEGGFVLVGKAGIKGAITLTFSNDK